MVDFAVLPPEVTSARMYAGAGSGPMVAAAAAWDRLASTLGSAAGSYRSVLSELTAQTWRGPASASMAAASEPYVEWMTTTAAQASVAANQARAAAAAYEAAHAAVVPPPVIAANRTQLQSLVSSNVLGQNSAAIAANQAEYSAMWAQDAAVMHSYAASSAAAADSVTTFNPPPQAGNSAAGSNALSQAQSAFAAMTQSAANTPNVFSPINQLIGTNTVQGLNSLSLPFGQFAFRSSGPMFFSEMVQLYELFFYSASGRLAMFTPIAAMNAMQAASGAGLMSSVAGEGSAASLAAATTPDASAGMGRATPIGKLSAPPSWATNAPEIRLAGSALPASAAGTSFLSQPGLGMAGGGLGGVPMVASMVNSPRAGDTRAKAGAGSGGASAPGSATDAGQAEPNDQTSTAGGSDAIDRELDQLREKMGDLAMECKAMARLMREAMR